MFGKLDLSFSQIVAEQIKNGELYLLATGLLAPIYYFTFPSARNGPPDRIEPFPSQQILVLLFISTVCISVLAIAATKVQAATSAIPERMISWSVWIFLFCCIVYLLTLTVKNSLEEITESVLDDQSRRMDRQAPPPIQPSGTGDPIDPDDMVASIIDQHRV